MKHRVYKKYTRFIVVSKNSNIAVKRVVTKIYSTFQDGKNTSKRVTYRTVVKRFKDPNTVNKAVIKHSNKLNSAVKRPAKPSDDSNPAVKRNKSNCKNKTVEKTTKQSEYEPLPFDEIFKDYEYNYLYEIYESKDPFFRHLNFSSFDTRKSVLLEPHEDIESTLEIFERLRESFSKKPVNKLFEDADSLQSPFTNISKLPPTKLLKYSESCESSESKYSNDPKVGAFKIKPNLLPSRNYLFKRTIPKNTDDKSKNNCISEDSLSLQKDLSCFSWMSTDYQLPRKSVSKCLDTKDIPAKSSQKSSSDALKPHCSAPSQEIVSSTPAKNLCKQVPQNLASHKTVEEILEESTVKARHPHNSFSGAKKRHNCESSCSRAKMNEIWQRAKYGSSASSHGTVSVTDAENFPRQVPPKFPSGKTTEIVTGVQRKCTGKAEFSSQKSFSETLKHHNSAPAAKSVSDTCVKNLDRQVSQSLPSAETTKVIVKVECSKLNRVPPSPTKSITKNQI